MKADGTVAPAPRNGASNNGAGVPIDPLTGDVNGTVGEERPPPGSGKSGGALAGSLSGGALETSWVGHVLSMGGDGCHSRSQELEGSLWSTRTAATAWHCKPGCQARWQASSLGRGASRLDAHPPAGGSPGRYAQRTQGAREGTPGLQGTGGSAGHGRLRACCILHQQETGVVLQVGNAQPPGQEAGRQPVRCWVAMWQGSWRHGAEMCRLVSCRVGRWHCHTSRLCNTGPHSSAGRKSGSGGSPLPSMAVVSSDHSLSACGVGGSGG